MGRFGTIQREVQGVITGCCTYFLLLHASLPLGEFRSNGAPMCTLGPRHGGYGSSGSWKDMVDVKIIPLNQNKLLDYKNKEKPNGNLVILKAKKQFKGIACQVTEPHRYGHEAVQLPMMHRNTKLKKLDCGTKGPVFFT